MYSYRESSKMRFGTLNVKGSLQGAAGVRLHVKRCIFVLLIAIFMFLRDVYIWGVDVLQGGF